VFAIQPHLEGAKALYYDIKRGAVEAGRSPAACKMLFRLQPIVGASRAEATDKQAEHNALVPLEGGLAILSGHLDFDQLTLPLNKGDGSSHGAQAAAHADALSLDDWRACDAAAGSAEPWPDGRPAADGGHAGRRRRPARGLFRLRRRRGFMLSPIYSPGAAEEFVDLVVPELQRRSVPAEIRRVHAARPSR
jgi:alkanesulfonate monooxygenase SsuD/methylene tetrahydromethanopterin reductase-like flavin-dependent oxidoreductase (luciferase family)